MIRQVHPSDLPHKALGGACREASASPDSRLAPDGGLEIGTSSRHGNETQQVDRERGGCCMRLQSAITRSSTG